MLNELLSITIIVLIGFVARRRGILGKREANLLNTVVMKLSLPALIFTSLIETELDWEFAKLIPLAFVMVLIMGLVSFLCARLLGLRPQSMGSFINAGMFLNSGFIGFPIIYQAFGDPGLVRVILFDLVGQNVTMFTLGLWVAARFGEDGYTRQESTKALHQVFTSPALIALVLGILGRGLPYPAVFIDALDWFGSISIPLIIFSLGVTFDFDLRELPPAPILTMVGLQLFLYPLLAAGLGLLFNLSGLTYKVGIIAAATPAAMGTLPIASEHGLDENLSAALIIVTTLACVLTIPLMSTLLGVY